jgi:hypothetical protein
MNKIIMKLFFITFLVLISLNFSNTVQADVGSSCHFHGTKLATEAVIIKCADQRKENLIKTNKLDGTWKLVKHDSVSLVQGKKDKEWKIIYKNSSTTDKAKINLYMFFTPIGNFIAANHTGQ